MQIDISLKSANPSIFKKNNYSMTMCHILIIFLCCKFFNILSWEKYLQKPLEIGN